MRLADKFKESLSKIINYLNPFYIESRCDWGGLCYPALNTIKPMEPHDTECKYAG